MISSALLAMAIKSLGCDAASYTAYQLGIKTSGQYGESLINDIHGSKIKQRLASLGAQVMHSRSIELGQKYQIPIYVGLSNSNIECTKIWGGSNMKMESKPVTGLATSENDVAITIEGIGSNINILSNMIEAVASKRINIDMISQTAPMHGKVNISYTIPREDLKECLCIVNEYMDKDSITIDEDITKFSIVGIGMKSTSGVAAKMFKVFNRENIEVKMITTSEIRITCAIKQADKDRAIISIAKEFNL